MTDVIALGHFFQGLFFHKHGAKCFVSSLPRMDGVNKEVLVLGSVHSRLPPRLWKRGWPLFAGYAFEVSFFWFHSDVSIVRGT